MVGIQVSGLLTLACRWLGVLSKETTLSNTVAWIEALHVRPPVCTKTESGRCSNYFDTNRTWTSTGGMAALRRLSKRS